MSDTGDDAIEQATAALAESEAQAGAVMAMLTADQEERRKSDSKTMLALVVALVLFVVDLLALSAVYVVLNKVRDVQSEGVERSKATKANTEDLKRIAKDTQHTASQLDCAFKVARENPGLSQANPQENLRLITECVDSRSPRGP